MRVTARLQERLDLAAIRLDVDGPCATIRMDRPEVRNAQSPATWRALAAVGDALPEDVTVVVVEGAGRSFSAGLDRRMFAGEGLDGEPGLLDVAALAEPEQDQLIAEYQDAFAWLRDGSAVSVAAVGGHAVGAGFQLALACDLRLCGDDAAFAMREITYGLVPDLTGTSTIVDAVGYSRALELCATGRWVHADEAHAIGLATAVVPRDQLDAAVADLVAALTTAMPGALRATKRLLRAARDGDVVAQRSRERREQRGRLLALAALAGR